MLTVTVPIDRIREKLDSRYGEMIKTVSFPGFRVGRVPRRILERRFASEVEDEVKDNLMAETLKEALEAQKLTALGEPKFDDVAFSREEKLGYKATVSVKPEFKLPKLEGIALESADTGVKDP